MSLEKRVEVLEKKVAELETVVQPKLEFKVKLHDSFDLNKFVKEFNRKMCRMKIQLSGL